MSPKPLFPSPQHLTLSVLTEADPHKVNKHAAISRPFSSAGGPNALQSHPAVPLGSPLASAESAQTLQATTPCFPSFVMSKMTH